MAEYRFVATEGGKNYWAKSSAILGNIEWAVFDATPTDQAWEVGRPYQVGSARNNKVGEAQVPENIRSRVTKSGFGSGLAIEGAPSGSGASAEDAANAGAAAETRELARRGVTATNATSNLSSVQAASNRAAANPSSPANATITSSSAAAAGGMVAPSELGPVPAAMTMEYAEAFIAHYGPADWKRKAEADIASGRVSQATIDAVYAFVQAHPEKWGTGGAKGTEPVVPVTPVTPPAPKPDDGGYGASPDVNDAGAAWTEWATKLFNSSWHKNSAGWKAWFDRNVKRNPKAVAEIFMKERWNGRLPPEIQAWVDKLNGGAGAGGGAQPPGEQPVPGGLRPTAPQPRSFGGNATKLDEAGVHRVLDALVNKPVLADDPNNTWKQSDFDKVYRVLDANPNATIEQILKQINFRGMGRKEHAKEGQMRQLLRQVPVIGQSAEAAEGANAALDTAQQIQHSNELKQQARQANENSHAVEIQRRADDYAAALKQQEEHNTEQNAQEYAQRTEAAKQALLDDAALFNAEQTEKGEQLLLDIEALKANVAAEAGAARGAAEEVSGATQAATTEEGTRKASAIGASAESDRGIADADNAAEISRKEQQAKALREKGDAESAAQAAAIDREVAELRSAQGAADTASSITNARTDTDAGIAANLASNARAIRQALNLGEGTSLAGLSTAQQRRLSPQLQSFYKQNAAALASYSSGGFVDGNKKSAIREGLAFAGRFN
jgi:hypothetical protein